MSLYSRVTTRRETSGLYTAVVDWSFDSRMVLGSFNLGEARARARRVSLAVGRVPLFMGDAS